MEPQEALDFVNSLVLKKKNKYLDEVQQSIFLASWDRKKYDEMYHHRATPHLHNRSLRDDGSRLWRLLSDVLGVNVSKKRLKVTVEEEYRRSQQVEAPQLALADAARNSVTTPDYWRNVQLLRTITANTYGVGSVAISPDGQTVKKYGVGSVAISPDGQTVASGSWDKTIKLWDLQTGKHRRTITGHSKDVASVMFLDEQTLVSAGYDRTVKLWHLQTGELLRTLLDLADEIESVTLDGHHHWIECLALHPNEPFLASGSFDKTINLWSLRLGVREPAMILGKHSAAVISLAFSPDGWTLAGGFMDGTIKLWDLRTQKHPRTWSSGSEWVPSVAFSPDGQILFSGSKEGSISLWNLDTEKLGTFERHSGAILSLTISPDGEILASSSWDNTINLWHLRDWRLLHTLNEHGDGAICVTFSPDGRTLVSGDGEGTIKIWQGVS